MPCLRSLLPILVLVCAVTVSSGASPKYLAFLLFPMETGAAERPIAGAQKPLLSLLGAWEEAGGTRILIEENRIVTYQNGRQSVQSILDYESGVLAVRDQGLKTTWIVQFYGSKLRVRNSDKAYEYNRLKSVPPEVILQPFRLGAPVEISPDRGRVIQEELRGRLQKDQEVLKSGKPADAVLAGNLRFLKELVQEIGWIDATRFGRQASADAILIAKHGNELDLMVAILPYVEKDFKLAGDDAQMFTVLYDGLQLDLGLKQRYGTQLGVDAKGEPMVLPLENVSKTDEFRKELGLPPLSEYLEVAGKALFGGRKIRLPRPDE